MGLLQAYVRLLSVIGIEPIWVNMNRPVLALAARACSLRSLQAVVQSVIIIFTFPLEMETLQSSTCLPVINVSVSYSRLFSGLHIHLTEMAKDV